ncbi:hypothetical protein JWZ98_06920 [Methylomonas sp. EFPC1]|uniref:hypothetical protein n=1 Tax=Methylomonas sp. EFPC1 TaxID=2812647 RepID=UPI0019673AE4|nr:hypothetical protein [Methylomonas sp. EFPC1]QSB02662.1 hypothetical protein JWZ98_06920 [Methylomonas sp. EFPC1]
MAHAKLFQNTLAAFFSLTLFNANSVEAASVTVSGDMEISNLRFDLADANAQLEWTDVWAGEVRAHSADSASPSSNDSNTSLANDTAIQAGASTNNGGTLAKFSVSSAGITASVHFDQHFDQPGMQGDSLAVASFDNYFKITNLNDPNAQGSVQVDFLLDYSGSLSGTADDGGFFSGLMHFTTMELYDGASLLDSAVFTDSISGTNTSTTRTNSGRLEVSTLLSYNTEYWFKYDADADYTTVETIPIPTSIVLFGSALLGLLRFSNRKLTTIKG